MKISFDRRAHEGETRVLTSFEKKVEIPPDSSLEETLDQVIHQYLGIAQLPERARDWRVVAIRDMSYRELAQIRAGRVMWLNPSGETLLDFFQAEAGTILVIPDQMPVPAVIPSDWQRVALPVLIDTRNTQYLALFLAIGVIIAIAALVVGYRESREILALPLVAGILCALGCYLTLLRGRRISFQEHIIIYRNRFNRYERFTPDQLDHMAWFAPGRDIKFVFRYEQKARNYISTPQTREVDLVVWAKSQHIPIYSAFHNPGRSFLQNTDKSPINPQ